MFTVIESMKFLESLPKHNLVGKHFQKDETILKEGDPTSEGICLVLKGKVKSDPSINNTKSIQRFYTQGMIFGLAALISNTRMESFQADEDNTYVIYIKEEDFYKSLLSDEKFLVGILQSSLDQLQKIPSSDLNQPKEAIDLKLIFGEDGEKKFQAIRDKNLKIMSYIYKLRNRFATPNENIFHEEKLEDSDIYMLVEGSVSQYLLDPSNPLNEIPVIDLQPGSLFGFLRKTDNKGHFLSARAGSEGAKLIHLDSDLLLKVAKLDAELAWAIFQNVVLTVAIVERTMIK